VIPAAQSHGALLADIHAADRHDDGFRVWWLVQSGFLLQWQDVHVVLDPYLSDSLTRKYSHTDTAPCSDDRIGNRSGTAVVRQHRNFLP
jgi:L-ascorbate metabolism protein UlaG (beta-lactamase superfamily)